MEEVTGIVIETTGKDKVTGAIIEWGTTTSETAEEAVAEGVEDETSEAGEEGTHTRTTMGEGLLNGNEDVVGDEPLR